MCRIARRRYSARTAAPEAAKDLIARRSFLIDNLAPAEGRSRYRPNQGQNKRWASLETSKQ